MKKRKLRKFGLLIRVLLFIVIILLVFDISFSLPTTFKEMIVEQIVEDEQLVITELDTERIHSISIEVPMSFGHEDVIRIEDKDIISTLLSNELRIRKGGSFKNSTDEYDLYVRFYGSTHRYTFAKDYIKTMDGNYKVLDDENEVYEYVKSLYEEGGKYRN